MIENKNILEIKNVTVSFDGFKALNSFSLDAKVQGSSQGLYFALKPCFANHVERLPESSKYFLSSIFIRGI